MNEVIINDNLIQLDVICQTRNEAIYSLAQLMEQEHRLFDVAQYEKDVLKREQLETTGIGFLVATPHAKSAFVKEPTVAFARFLNPIKWDEDVQAQLIFLIAVPDKGYGEKHLEILAALFRQVVHEEFLKQLMESQSKQEVFQILSAVID